MRTRRGAQFNSSNSETPSSINSSKTTALQNHSVPTLLDMRKVDSRLRVVEHPLLAANPSDSSTTP